MASVVEEGFVEEVRDASSGLIHYSAVFLKQEEIALTRLRAEIEDLLEKSKSRFQCAHCGVAVRLRLSQKQNWYFRHVEDDGSCRYQSQGVFSRTQLDARRYNGQKEGPQHRRMKRLILESLRADPSVEPTSILEEVRWAGKHRPGTWRRPDVQALRNSVRFAFEVQLSSTYISVMRERTRFYLEEGGLLFWIMTNLGERERRQFENDVLYPNNCNMFAVDEETRNLSIKQSVFQLRCGFLKPVRNRWRVLEQWVEGIVSIDDLILDPARQRVYYFDYDSARARLQDEVRTIDGVNVLDVFRDKLLTPRRSPDWNQTWRKLKKQLPRELMWPKDDQGHHFFKVVGMYLSAREGRPIGWEFKNLIETAHWCAQSYPYLLPLCIECFHTFGRDHLFTSQQYGKQWAAKLEKVRGRDLHDQRQQYLPSLSRYRDALQWLLPEVRAGLDRIFGALS